MKANSNIAFYLCLLFLPFLSEAQTEKSKVIKETFPLNAQGKITITHRRGPIYIKPSLDGQTTVTATIKVRGDDATDVQKALDNIKIDFEASGNFLNVRSGDNIKNWVTILNKSKVTFVNGAVVSGIKDIHIELAVNVPKTIALDLTNKYDNIYLADHTGDLRVDLYDADLNAESCQNLYLKLKYGKGYLHDVKNATLELYDSHLDLKKAQSIEATVKYSNLKWGDLQKLKLISYDSKYIIGNVLGETTIEDKYSEFSMGNIQNATLNLYDANLVMGQADQINLNSKYCHIKGVKAAKITLNESYDDEVEFQELNEFWTKSKYTKYIIGKVNSSVIMDTYDDEFNIAELGSELQELNITGKYLKFQSKLNAAAELHLQANTKYGQLNYPQSRAEVRVHKEKNDDLELDVMIGKNVSGRKGVINCYDCKISF